MTAPVADGLVVVDKPGGMTSHDVVARVRRALGTRKVGHAGTLDPMATGVLVLGVNRATRLLGHLMLTEKAYDATIRLGASTTTDDAEGEVVATATTDHLTEAGIREALAAFVGEIDQKPTAVSAIKVDGKRAYQRVRDGEDVDLPARRVTIHALEVTGVRGSDVDISVRCSSGTYIRAIARDLGAALGVGGHLVALRRTAVGRLRPLPGAQPRGPRRRTVGAAHRGRRPGDVPGRRPGRADGRRGARRAGRSAWSLPGAGEHALFAPDGDLPGALRAHRGRSPPRRRLRRLSGVVGFGPCRSGVPSTTCRPTSAARSSRSATSTACTSATAHVLAQARATAAELGVDKVVVVTFDPHPMAVLRPEHAPPILTSVETRARLVEEAGIDAVLVVPFDRDIAGWTPGGVHRPGPGRHAARACGRRRRQLPLRQPGRG